VCRLTENASGVFGDLPFQDSAKLRCVARTCATFCERGNSADHLWHGASSDRTSRRYHVSFAVKLVVFLFSLSGTARFFLLTWPVLFLANNGR